MFRFTIRDLLWLTAFVAVAIVWLTDRNAMRRERTELALREAELTARAKMWEAEANRAEKRQVDSSDTLLRLSLTLNRLGMSPSDLLRSSTSRKKLILVDDDHQK
jgi:hypothetical protein